MTRNRPITPLAPGSALAALIAAFLILGLPLASRAAASVYWANNGGTTIGRAALDGTSASQRFVSGAVNPCGVAVDEGHLYWGNQGGRTIGRANLDGTAVNQSFIGGATGPCGIAVDAAHVYWANLNAGTIGRANLDGTGVNQSFIAVADEACGVAVDGKHVYWTRLLDGTIGRANLDGTGVNQTFISGANGPCGVAADAAHVYWANGIVGGGSIGRANLDGTGVNQSFIAGTNDPCGVAFDVGHLYWANAGNGTIGRANLDGTGVNQSFVSGANGPCGVAVNELGVGYPRPKGASPLRVSLVPAFNPCDAPNTRHGAPLSAGSCTPPVQASSFLTVGTPDVNKAAANAVASVRFAAVTGDPATPADEADVTLEVSASDVRLAATLGDYTGELQANVRLRLEDRGSGPAFDEPATVQDFVYRFTVPCQTTVSTTVGSTCALATSADAIQPGSVKEKARTIWQLGQVSLFDGGPDGVASTAAGNTVFETQGIFVP
jgi:virginiamycin B lyase